MDRDKKFHELVNAKGIDSAIKEYHPNLSPGQVKAVTRHANELVDSGKIQIN